jgi:hypothetical protein
VKTLLLALALSLAANTALAADVCKLDGAIGTATYAAIKTIALAYAHALLDGDGAKSVTITDVKIDPQTGKPVSAMAQLIAVGRPFSAVKLDHVYLVSAPAAQGRATCGTGNESVFLAVGPGGDEAYALISAQSRNDGWALVLKMAQDAAGWQVKDAHLTGAGTAGRSSQMMLAQARSERASGHAFNATILYIGVLSTMDRGADFQTAFQQTVRGDIANLPTPPELQGPPPFKWTMGGKTFSVQMVSMIGIGKDLGLIFNLPQTDWPATEAIEARNREFLDAFRATHPDFTRVFSFLVARAFKPDNSGGFATVWDSTKGYR